MPTLSFNEVAIGFDMFGCPNRCRHCWVPAAPNRPISEQQVRDITAQFRAYRRPDQNQPHFKKLWVSTAIREPDFPDHYRQLHALSAELSDDKPWRYELLSIWRLARDESYAPWAKSVGPDTCQITFFGEEAATDWFYKRRGAFRDALLATERLLDAGMKPRWQIFANTRGIPELASLLRRVEQMRLCQRVADLGGKFDIFIHAWGANGQTLDVEPLRPTLTDAEQIPADLLESSRSHFGHDELWHTEQSLCQQILARDPWFRYTVAPGPFDAFLITSDLDVFHNAFDMDPWWCLGNLRSESLETILNRFQRDDTLGLRTINTIPAQELVRQHGRTDGQRLHTSADDLMRHYVALHCRQ
ncbi:MAG: hypothetical protein IT442_09720 [Phycisphaeraceae bacterium]|nr:hypothetical protein [Phycisphaeraceae bacterium]